MFTIVATRHQRKSYVTTAGIQSFQLQCAGGIRVEKRNQTYIYIFIYTYLRSDAINLSVTWEA